MANVLVVIGLYGSFTYELMPHAERVFFGWAYYVWANVGIPFMFSTMLLTTDVCKTEKYQFKYRPYRVQDDTQAQNQNDAQTQNNAPN